LKMKTSKKYVKKEPIMGSKYYWLKISSFKEICTP
jgi:hypothetical protein